MRHFTHHTLSSYIVTFFSDFLNRNTLNAYLLRNFSWNLFTISTPCNLSTVFSGDVITFDGWFRLGFVLVAVTICRWFVWSHVRWFGILSWVDQM